MSVFSLNDVMWRHVTSPGQIFTKISENVPFIYILLMTKYEVNWIISLKVMNNNVFFSSNMEIYRKMLFLPQNQPKYDIREGITSEPLVIGRWLTPHLKALCSSLQHSMLGCPICYHFCWRQQYFCHFELKTLKMRHVTSHDVIISDFHQTFKKCFTTSYITSVKV